MNEQPNKSPRATPIRKRRSWSFFDYFWFVFKNVVGWIFILASPGVGLTLPGPGGVPLFLLGFALVTFPGKRKITSHVMRGRPVEVDPGVFTFLATVASIIATATALYLLVARYERMLNQIHLAFLGIFGICGLAAGITWLVMRAIVGIVNWALRRLPRVRRFMRPRLRKHGINLLPPRHSQAKGVQQPDQDEILAFSDDYRRRFKATWVFLLPWLKRLFSVTITIAIVLWMIRPIRQHWDEVHTEILKTNPLIFVTAAMMFAVFLVVFRSVVWWKILQGLGHTLPFRPAVRIWSLSELARYVPGSVMQFVGRVYLIKPYGVSGSVCSTSQILELSVFLLSNIIVALSCLFYFGFRNMHGLAQEWLLIVAALVPLLVFLLHPKVFYPLVNWVMRKRNKPPIANQLRKRNLTAMATWTILGLLWQSLAVWLLSHDLLPLPLKKWWVVAGSYCLAWCAGFLAFWAPGGMGVREFVFATAMQFALPPAVRDNLPKSPEAVSGILIVLAVLLRLWTIAGELIVAGLSYLADYRGAMGQPDAPGRKAPATPAPTVEGVSV